MKKLLIFSALFLLSNAAVAMEGGWDSDEEIQLALAEQEAAEYAEGWYASEDEEFGSELEDYEMESTQEPDASQTDGLVSSVLRSEQEDTPIINTKDLITGLTQKNALDQYLFKNITPHIAEYFLIKQARENNPLTINDGIKESITQKLLSNDSKLQSELGSNNRFNIKALKQRKYPNTFHPALSVWQARLQYDIQYQTHTERKKVGLFKISEDLYQALEFLEQPRWQFAGLLNDIGYAIEKNEKLALSQGDEKVFSYLPPKIKDILEEHVIHPLIDSKQESIKKEL